MSNTRPAPRKISNSNFTNNTGKNTLKNRFDEIMNGGVKISYLDFLVGFLRIGGFKHLYEIIEKKISELQEVRILVGMDTDDLIAKLAQGNISPTDANSQFQDIFIKQQSQYINNGEYSQLQDDSLEMLFEALRTKKIQMRIIRGGRVHAKFYVFSSEPTQNKTSDTASYRYSGSVIVGSSNLSHNGLERNYEFNAELNSSEDIENALYEFEELWKQGVEITSDTVIKVQEKTYQRIHTPKDLYYKMLIEYFGIERIQIDRSVKRLFPKNYKSLKYQIDAVAEGVRKIEKYNGFFLSDVVGLGKTLIATVIAKKLEDTNKFRGSILVTCPPALIENWKEHFRLVGIERNREIVTHDLLDNVQDIENYGLIIVDESHRFRTEDSQRYKNLEQICKNKVKGSKKVILLSATPQNNSPLDLKNQINLFQNMRNSSIGDIVNLENFFASINLDYARIKKELKEIEGKQNTQNKQIQLQEQLKRISEKMRDELLRHIMIRRTRSDVERLFGDDLEKQGLFFPKQKELRTLHYPLSPNAERLSIKTLELLELEGEYKYSRYLIYPNLTKQGQSKYKMQMGGKRDDIFYVQTAERLTGLMKSLMFKRFESSIYSFIKTLDKQILSISSLITMLKGRDIISLPKDNFANLEAYYEAIESGDEETFEQFVSKNQRNMMQLSPLDFSDTYVEDLQRDLQILTELRQEWIDENNRGDSKLKFLIEELKKLLAQNIEFDRQKILIFTEAKTTAQYLGQELKKHFGTQVLQVDSANRSSCESLIRENFDANYPEKKWRSDINIIVTTDTLAEGVNMHRSNIIINYDAPWNATRMMQRAGRINRVGTKHKEIIVFNFMPTSIGDKILKLSKQIFQKLQSFHYTFGEDSAIYNNDEKIAQEGLFLETEDIENQYLADIIKLYEEDPKEFHRLAKLPKKIRTMMDGDGASYFFFKQTIQENYGTKSQIRTNDAFYKVQLEDNGLIQEREAKKIRFETMAEFLKHSIDKQPIKLNKKIHYDDAQRALTYHQQLLHQKFQKSTDTLSSELSQRAKKARKVVKNSTISDESRTILLHAINEGVLSKADESKIANLSNSELEDLAQKASKLLDFEHTTQDEVFFQNPEIQLSFTTKETKCQ